MSIIMMTLGMFIVTYIPRMLPVVVHNKIKLPGWANNWLKSIPFAVLGALIIPGIINVNKENQFVGIISGIVAVCIAYFEFNIAYVIGAAILVSVIMLNFIK